jgi:hypothetical protein
VPSEVNQDRAGFEHAQRLLTAAVDQRRNLRVGIDLDEAARELVTFVDPDEPGVVFGAGMAEREQLFQHNRDLDAIRSPQRIQLQRVLADGKCLLMGGAGNRTVNVGKRAARGSRGNPDLRWHIL